MSGTSFSDRNTIISGQFSLKQQRTPLLLYSYTLISDGNIALANKSIKNIYNNDYFILDIVLLETNSIIGSIKVKKDDININVDDDCLMDSLKLLNKFICIFLNDNKNYKIKQLINDII